SEVGAARQQVRDLLECAWPAVLDAASQPLTSASWQAAVTVAVDHIGASGDLGVIGPAGWDTFAAAARRKLGATRWYGDRACGLRRRHRPHPHRSRGGQPARRSPGTGPVRPRRPVLGAETAIVEARMLDVLDQLGLTELVASIP